MLKKTRVDDYSLTLRLFWSQKTDVTNELVEEIQIKTKEFLQPNPTARAKMAAVKGISKLSGQAKSNTYPQAEGLLADCMLMYGKKLGENSIFGMYSRAIAMATSIFLFFTLILSRIIFAILSSYFHCGHHFSRFSH